MGCTESKSIPKTISRILTMKVSKPVRTNNEIYQLIGEKPPRGKLFNSFDLELTENHEELLESCCLDPADEIDSWKKMISCKDPIKIRQFFNKNDKSIGELADKYFERIDEELKFRNIEKMYHEHADFEDDFLGGTSRRIKLMIPISERCHNVASVRAKQAKAFVDQIKKWNDITRKE